MRGVTVFRGVVALTLLGLVGCGGTGRSEDDSSFAELERDVNQLMEEQDYEEAIRFLKRGAKRFPEHEYEIEARLAVAYAHAGEYERCLDIWEAGLERGYFFRIQVHPRHALFQPFEKLDRFQSIARENERLRAAAIRRSKSKIRVTVPASEGRADFPLLMVLHGGRSSMARAERYWQTPRLRKRFVVAYVQSYLYEGLKSYGWRPSDPRAMADIRKLYEDIVARYPVDRDKVVIGGASAGGVMAIDVSLNDLIPTAGFIGVCPGKPPRLDSISVSIARERGLRGVIIAGEQDRDLSFQTEMVELFRREYFPHELIVIPGLADAYPSDFSRRVDLALDYILAGE